METEHSNIFVNKEETLLRLLDKRLELEQMLKLCQLFPTEKSMLYQELDKRKFRLDSFRSVGTITEDQYNLLFPLSKASDFTKFGYLLLHILISNFCGMSIPINGWNKDPLLTDQSESACYVRIMFGREMIKHVLKGSVIYKEYQKIFNYVRQALLGVGCENKELEQFLISETHNLIAPVTNFFGRLNELTNIHKSLQDVKINKQLCLVITGKQGIGKTQTLRKYCQIYSHYFDHNILWFNTATKYSLKEGFRDLSISLGLPVKNDLGNFLNINTIISNISDYLEHTKVLYIFENVHSCYQIMKHLPPVSNKTFVIIITQNQFSSNKFLNLNLNGFTTVEAEEFLRKGTHLGDNDVSIKARKQIVKLLQCHPLALSLVIAYIKETNTKVHEYLNILKQTIQEDLPYKIQNDTTFLPIYSTFYISFNYLKRLHNMSAYILSLLSYLDGNYINLHTLQDAVYEKFKDYYQIKETLKLLRKFSFIQTHYDREKVENILLIQSSIQEAIKTENTLIQMETLVNLLNHMFKESGTKQQLHITCGEHWISHLIYISTTKDYYHQFLIHCLRHQEFLYQIFSSKGQIEDLLEIFWENENTFLDDNDCKGLYIVKINIARVYQALGGIDEALIEYEYIQNKLIMLFGDAEETILETQFLMATCLYKQQQYIDALDLCKQILSQLSKHNYLQEKRIGIEILFLKCSAKCEDIKNVLERLVALEKHEETGDIYKVSWKNTINIYEIKLKIADILFTNGDFGDAIKKYEEAEGIQIQILGHKHPHVLKTQTKLANCFYEMDKFDEMLDKCNDIVVFQTFTYGENHMKTVKTKYNIAKALQNKGDLENSYKIFKLVEKSQILYLEENQQDLIKIKGSLGHCLHLKGKYKEAISKYKEVEEAQVQIFGHFDCEVLKTKHTLSACLHNDGQLQNAMHLYQQIKTTQIQMLGKNHVDTLRTELNLSVCLLDSGQEDLALLKFLNLEKTQIQQLGLFHPDLLTTQHNIAMCLYKKKRFEAALKRYMKVEESQKQLLGDNNFYTLNTKHNIAVCLHDDNQFNNAIKKYEEVLAYQYVTLEPSHPDVLATRYNIAVCIHDAKNLAKAVAELENIEELQIDRLGEEHIDVKRTQASLAVCRREVKLWGDTLYCNIL